MRELRESRHWSQQELAQKAGVSRAEVSAVETGRLVPSVAAALALAQGLGATVESLFGAAPAPVEQGEWAAPPRGGVACHWEAEVRGRVWRYPWEGAGALLHCPGSILGLTTPAGRAPADPARTLVLATEDPAAGLMSAQMWRDHQVRLLILSRNSVDALEWLQAGKVHAAGLDLADADEETTAEGGQHVRTMRQKLGDSGALLRIADWEEGIAVSDEVQGTSLPVILKSRVRWVGREPGSGARVCQDRLRAGSRTAIPQCARSPWGVAEALRNGWAEIGVCSRMVSEAAGLRFFPVRTVAYDLCFPEDLADDYRLRALLETVRSRGYREKLAMLPGISLAKSGQMASMNGGMDRRRAIQTPTS